jgi:cation:H+ antiporter
MLFEVFLLAIGSAVLIGGAEVLIRGASRLAVSVGISPLVVGLTVVAFGTSAPELAVTVGASYAGEPELALGNIVGSNIFNVLMILGTTAAVAPLVVSRQLVRFDVPLMIVVSLVVSAMALDGRIDRLDGAVLFAGILGYTVFSIVKSRSESALVQKEYETALHASEAKRSSAAVNILLMVAGLVLLVLGARWLVEGATAIAQALGVSELVIGLTIVAAGTSLPEIATSVLAALRGERDIAVGNVVGSNLFNLMAVLGLGSIVAPEGVPVSAGALTFDIPVMIAAAIGMLPICFTGYLIARWEGLLLMGYYVAYASFIALQAADHQGLDEFRRAMVYFVMPLTAITIVVVTARSLERRRRDRRRARRAQ